MSSKQLAERFIRDQFAIMRKYGPAPRLTADQRKDLIAATQRTFEMLRRTAAAVNASKGYGPFRQAATIDGVPIVIGGEDDPVPVHLQDRDRVYNCRASRHLARELAAFLFQTPIRATGIGTWFRSRDGEWEMKRFTIQSFIVLRSETVAEAAARLQNLPTRLQKSDDPLSELLSITGDGGQALLVSSSGRIS